jgi:hypothetical protein
VDVVADSLLLADFLLCFRKSFFNQDTGELIADPRLVAKHYLANGFALDAFTVFPVSFIYNISIGDSITNTGGAKDQGGLRGLRLLRLFRGLRWLRPNTHDHHVRSILNIEFFVNPAMVRFSTSFVTLLFMWHLIACAYWAVILVEYEGIGACPPPPSNGSAANITTATAMTTTMSSAEAGATVPPFCFKRPCIASVSNPCTCSSWENANGGMG